MSQPFKLFRLQQIDSRLDALHSRLRDIEVALSEDRALRQAKQKAEESELALQNANKALRKAEGDVHAQRIKIEQTEATLYGGKVRNPKELQDLQNESSALKRYLAVLEDRQLEAMLIAEDVELRSQEAQAELERVEAQTLHQNSSLMAERDTLSKDLLRQESERQAAASSIAPGDLRLYEELRQQRSGVAVAKVSEKACAACGNTLSASLLQAARSPNQITRCTTCGRILYAG